MRITNHGVLIVAALESKGIGKVEAFAKMKMSASHFYQVIKGERRLTGMTAFKLQDITGIKAEELLRMQFERELRELKQIRKLKKTFKKKLGKKTRDI